MIAKITSGYSFRDAVNYVLDENKNAKLLFYEGVRVVDDEDNRERITDSFLMQTELNSRTKKHVGHISLSFAIEDKDQISDSFMVKVAQEYLSRMKIENTQVVMVRHFDTAHSHLHILYNRINNEGKTISDSNERMRSFKICRELTKKHGLHVSEGKKRVNIHRLEEPDKSRYEIYEALKKNLPRCENWLELQQMLKRYDINVRFKYKGKTDEIQGVVFLKDGLAYNGSKVDKQYSYSKITKQLNENNFLHQLSRKENQSQTKQTDLIDAVLEGISSVSVSSGGDNYEEELFIHRIENEDKQRRYKNKRKKRGRSF